MDATELKTLRRQRNIAAVAAVAFLVVSMGVTLPRALRSRAELKAANTELVRLQSEIVAAQDRIRAVQGEILATQESIRELQK